MAVLNNFLKKVFCITILLVLFINTSYANLLYNNDIEVKAAFIYRLLHFIEWPENDAKDINICIIGDNPFKKIKNIFEKKSFEERNIRLKDVSINSIYQNGCAIVFISESEKTNFREIISSLESQPILTISDIAKFAKNNGMIGFTSFNSQIKLELNLSSLSNSKFKLDPNLLEVALYVY